MINENIGYDWGDVITCLLFVLAMGGLLFFNASDQVRTAARRARQRTRVTLMGLNSPIATYVALGPPRDVYYDRERQRYEFTDSATNQTVILNGTVVITALPDVPPADG